MKTTTALVFIIATIASMASPKIKVMPELAAQVNSQTTNNSIPWYGSGEYDALVTGQLDNLVPLAETTQGDYNYTLYRVRFHNVNVIEGEFDAKELTFYLERPFPRQESGIKFKELWPFQKGCVRTFKLKKVDTKFHIVSLEKEPQQAAPRNR